MFTGTQHISVHDHFWVPKKTCFSFLGGFAQAMFLTDQLLHLTMNLYCGVFSLSPGHWFTLSLRSAFCASSATSHYLVNVCVLEELDLDHVQISCCFCLHG